MSRREEDCSLAGSIDLSNDNVGNRTPISIRAAREVSTNENNTGELSRGSRAPAGAGLV